MAPEPDAGWLVLVPEGWGEEEPAGLEVCEENVVGLPALEESRESDSLGLVSSGDNDLSDAFLLIQLLSSRVTFLYFAFP